MRSPLLRAGNIRARRAALATTVLYLVGVQALLNGASAGEITAESEPATASGSEVTALPTEALYPRYLADPHAPTFSAQFAHVFASDIPETSVQRYLLRLGGQLPLLESRSLGLTHWQLGIAAGFSGQFDIRHSTDNLGWDGILHLIAAFRGTGARVYKLASQHVSSHVGDEYAERTGRTRIAYTRNELVGGISQKIDDHWRAYGEVGWGYSFKNDDLQKPGRIQVGLEFESPLDSGARGHAWYAAADLSATQERDWAVNVDLQLGVAVRRAERDLRAAIEFYDGRASLGEFFQSDERYLGTGIWLDI